jgi:two-component system, NtrC family, response regulator AtoC
MPPMVAIGTQPSPSEIAKGAPVSHVLIVEDERDTRTMMAAWLATQGYTVSQAGNLQEARAQLALRTPDLVLLDLHLPDGSGLGLLREPTAAPQCDVVLITGHATLDTSIEAMRLGAVDYLIKPVSPQQLQGMLSRVAQPGVFRAELAHLEAQWRVTGKFGHLIGTSEPMAALYQQIGRVAASALTVMIIGESGTGKELVARTLHDLSRRRTSPFVAINCSAISPHLFESEIFGHEKGSFTGAQRQHEGIFERARGGTLLLDEITEMPIELQAKLLRILETRVFTRVGSTRLIEADVRIIAATNRDPVEAVKEGKLREDLLYRLNAFPLEMPPLRRRTEDIPVLAAHFLQEMASSEGGERRLSARALDALQAYGWPGNVRELKHAVQRAFVMEEGQEITDKWLPRRPDHRPAEGKQSSGVCIPVGSTLAQAERLLILATLAHFDHHKERTAAALGVSLKTLYNRLKEYGAEE